MTLRPWHYGALLLAVFHLLFVVIPLVTSGGHGEGQAFLVLFAEFPLVLLLDHIPGGGYILYNSTLAYVAFFSSVGTVMYACIGAVLGALLTLFLRAVRSAQR